VSRYQKGKTSLDFTEARDSESQWHQLGHMQVCTSLQTDNHASNPPLHFLQAGCPSCRPTNSIKALKAFTQPADRHYVFDLSVRACVRTYEVGASRRRRSSTEFSMAIFKGKIADLKTSILFIGRFLRFFHFSTFSFLQPMEVYLRQIA